MVKKCVMRGYLPLLICGTGTVGTTYRNYGSHSNDYVKYDPFGGGFSTMMFTLQNLFEEFQKHRCNWSRSNDNLELIRYKGCTMKLYRHPECDFIFQYNRKQPFVDSQLTGPYLHPGMAIMRRNRKLIPSFKTKPKGRSYIKVRIKPPTLFNDHWYFQKDLCKLPLLTIGASAASLRFPFCSPQTDNICIYFLVLHKWYNKQLSITTDYPKKLWDALKNQLKTHWSAVTTQPNKGPLGTVFNTFYTQEHIRDPDSKTAKRTDSQTANYYTKINSLWGDHVYEQSIIDKMEQNQQNMYSNRKMETYLGSQYLNFKTGVYSAIFLSPSRLSPDFPGLYQEVVYNPANDKGVGNKVWVDWCSKNDSSWTGRDSTLPIVDLPLWAALMGYADYAKKHFHDPGYIKEARLTIICPYTQPPLTNTEDTDMGFIPYDYNFANSKMPDGNGYIPLNYRFQWYPCMFHQQNFMNDMVQCGPFAYHGEQKSVTLTAKYTFKFLFGGNPILQQTVKDPCKQPDFHIPGTGGVPPRLQVTNPKLLDEGYFFKAWDIRRGLFGAKALKRMSEQQINAEFFTGPPKRPRFEVPALQGEDYDSQVRKLHPWPEDSESESEAEAPQEEEPKKPIQEQLEQQLREQKQLGRTVQHIIHQLVKTQHHLHVPIIH